MCKELTVFSTVEHVPQHEPRARRRSVALPLLLYNVLSISISRLVVRLSGGQKLGSDAHIRRHLHSAASKTLCDHKMAVVLPVSHTTPRDWNLQKGSGVSCLGRRGCRRQSGSLKPGGAPKPPSVAAEE